MSMKFIPVDWNCGGSTALQEVRKLNPKKSFENNEYMYFKPGRY